MMTEKEVEVRVGGDHEVEVDHEGGDQDLDQGNLHSLIQDLT